MINFISFTPSTNCLLRGEILKYRIGREEFTEQLGDLVNLLTDKRFIGKLETCDIGDNEKLRAGQSVPSCST